MLSAAAGAQLTPQPMGSTVPRAGPVQHEGLYLNSQVNNQATRLAAPAAQHQSPVITAFQNRQQPASSHPQQQHAAAEPYPEAVGIFCNGNHGVYLVNRRGVQCLCKVCQENRRNNPNTDLWLVSPTEFERHSGMSSAKKWRSRCVVFVALKHVTYCVGFADLYTFATVSRLLPSWHSSNIGQPQSMLVALICCTVSTHVACMADNTYTGQNTTVQSHIRVGMSNNYQQDAV
eukprot:GHUV01039940.1.p1 GENE.GHUV01039940.1~~GHUV01039940.1.p1  ORF type:complete len:232 (+),score=38.58 GHUV01039940.1:620-1315(+)